MIVRPSSPDTGTRCDFGPLRTLIILKDSLQRLSLSHIESETLADLQQSVQNACSFYEVFKKWQSTEGHEFAKSTSTDLRQLPEFLKKKLPKMIATLNNAIELERQSAEDRQYRQYSPDSLES